MKQYNTDQIEIKVRVLDDPNVKHMKIVCIQFGKYEELGLDDEVEMIIPNSIVKKKITNGSFAKHILDYLIKE